MFKRISDEDVHFMGFSPIWSRPEWMICNVLPVPPPAVRPSVTNDTGQRCHDDLTHKLSDIIKTNNYNSYLEIGVESGETFNNIICNSKK